MLNLELAWCSCCVMDCHANDPGFNSWWGLGKELGKGQ